MKTRAFSLEVLASKTATQTPVMRAQPLSLRNAPVSSARGHVRKVMGCGVKGLFREAAVSARTSNDGDPHTWHDYETTASR